MFSHINGIVFEVSADRAVIEAAGVGYELLCSANTLKRLAAGEQARLFVHFHIAQDSVALYGFHDVQERAMFRRLIGVTRVGPKAALSVLSVLTPQDVALAVMTDNAAAFDRVPGMGRKTAARVILELKEKVETSCANGIPSPGEAAGNMRSDAIAALVSLGYDGAVAGRAVASIDECDRVEELITLALRKLSK